MGDTVVEGRPYGEVLISTYNARGLFEGSSGIDDKTSFVYVSSTDYTATGGIDEQTLGNGVINDFRQTLRVYDRVDAHEPIDNRRPVRVEGRSTGNP